MFSWFFSFMTVRRTLILFGFVAALVPSMYYYGFWSGKKAGRKEVQIENLKSAVALSEVKSEIRNRRPDDDALFERLLNGTF